jgi:hypothetical protein
VETKEAPIEFEKSIEAMLAADLEPFSFKRVPPGDAFAALMAIITPGDAD